MPAQAVASAGSKVAAIGATTIKIGAVTVKASTVGAVAAGVGALAGTGVGIHKYHQIDERITNDRSFPEKVTITLAELCGYGAAFKDIVEVHAELGCWYKNLLWVIHKVRLNEANNDIANNKAKALQLSLLEKSIAVISQKERDSFLKNYPKASKNQQKFLMPGQKLRGMFLYLMIEEKLFYTESRKKYPDSRVELLYSDQKEAPEHGGLAKKEPLLLISGSSYSLENNQVALKVAQEIIISLVTAAKAEIINSIPGAKVKNPNIEKSLAIKAELNI